MSVSGWVVSANINLPSCTLSRNYLLENENIHYSTEGGASRHWAFLGCHITGAPIQETHPVLGMEKLMRVYKAEG